MRLGVFGLGRIGSFHAQGLRHHPGVDGLVLYDADEARCAKAAAELDAVAAESPRQLLETAPDAVVIATPTSTHAELLSRCVDAGVPTFCEKPVALELGALRNLVDHVASAGIAVQIGFQRRFDAGYREARRRLHSGELGRLFSFRVTGYDMVPPADSYIATSGGIFRDLHIHDFDIVRFVTGQEVDEVYAAGAVLASPAYTEHGDFDNAAAVLRLADGVLGVLTGGRRNASGYDVRMELLGAGGSVAVGLDERVPLASVEPGMRAFDGPPYRDFQERFADAYRSEMTAFLDVARGDAPSPCSVADALAALRVATAADRSARAHRPVRMSEIEP